MVRQTTVSRNAAGHCFTCSSTFFVMLRLRDTSPNVFAPTVHIIAEQRGAGSYDIPDADLNGVTAVVGVGGVASGVSSSLWWHWSCRCRRCFCCCHWLNVRSGLASTCVPCRLWSFVSPRVSLVISADPAGWGETKRTYIGELQHRQSPMTKAFCKKQTLCSMLPPCSGITQRSTRTILTTKP